MKNVTLILVVVAILGCQSFLGECQNCEVLSTLSGRISGDYSGSRCWKVEVPVNSFIRLKIIIFPNKECNYASLVIKVAKTGEQLKYCRYSTGPATHIAFNDITVTFTSNYYNTYEYIDLKYEIQSVECNNDKSFRCSNHKCIPESKVCDGVEDCENGSDEIGCETGIKAFKGVTIARKAAISWLKSTRTPSWGWKENTPRAIVALYLASETNFNGTDLEEELMAKQTELKISVALLRSSLSNNQLSMFLNSLLVVCHNPRSFYGNNLVKRLKEQVEQTQNFTHPLAYIALCNANETWPHKAVNDLNSILNSTSDYPFVRDIQAMAVMALSCKTKFEKQYNTSQNSSTYALYQDAIKRFKEFQQEDGSFGNIYTTAMITQALISSGQEDSEDWNVNATIQHLIQHLNSSSTDFLSTYLALPILNGNTLVDIANIDCSQNPRKHGDDILSEIGDYMGPKMRIQYSLLIGDDKDIVHTISLLVPVNYTAYEVMELAELENSKYRFQRKIVSEQVYVFEIAGIPNDSEVGKFWLLYLSITGGTGSFKHLTTSPDKLVLKDGEHLILWYKTASI